MRLLRLLGAALVTAPLLLVATTAQGEQVAPHAVPPRLQQVDLVAVVQAAGATGAAEQTLQSPVTPLGVPVAVVGLTWDGTAPVAARAELRQHTAAGWGAWLPVEVETSEEDGRGGTEPFVVTGADQVQGRLTGQGSALPTGVRLLVVDPGASSADAQAAQTAGSFSASAVAAPAIASRSAWGADESLRTGTPSYATVRAAVVHHTAGSNTYTAAEVPAVLRGIYAFHTSGRGWADVGYNVLADRYGRLWEGRYGGLDKGVVGAHVAGYNTGSFGVSVMGTFDTAAPPAVTQEAVAQVLAWKLSLSGVSATSTTSLAGATIPAVVGHRDLGQTACPGQAFYDRLGAIRTRARALQVAGGTTTPPPAPPTPPAAPVPAAPIARDLDGDGTPDVLSRASGVVSVSARVPNTVLEGRVVGTGWSGVDLAVGSPDLTGDGRADLLVRAAATGVLSVYAGDGRGLIASTSSLGRGWGRVRHVLAPGDVDGDGRADVLSVAADGRLWLYPGAGAGRLGTGVMIGRGFGAFTTVTGVRDLTGDRRADLLAVDPAGALLVYPGTGRGGFVAPVVLDPAGAAGLAAGSVVGAGDWDRDGLGDLVLRNPDGSMTTRFARVGPALEPATRWGGGWSALRSLTGPGDWDGDGRADLLAIGPDGTLRLYAGTGARDFATPRPLAIPAVASTDLVLVAGDVTGDGHTDLVSRTTAGELHLTRGARKGALGASTLLGAGWSGADLVTAVGDLSGDGVPDLVARNRSEGTLSLYRMTRAGTVLDRVTLGRGWNGVDLLVGPGPWDDDTRTDLLARRSSDGALVLYPGTVDGRLGEGRVVGTGWGPITTVLGVGDHDRDGHGDLLVRSPGLDRVFRGDGRGGFATTGTTVTVLGLPAGAVLS